MLDLASLLIFEKVASLRSFTVAARALGLPKSNVSRAIARLEEELNTRLFQRTTRDVMLTATGEALLNRSSAIIAHVGEALDYIGSLAGRPRGQLKITSGIGFGVKVLAEQLPDFLLQYPDINIVLDLDSRAADLVADSVDVAVRLGPLPDSGLVAVKLGDMRRYLCAAPTYLNRRGLPDSIEELATHDLVDMPSQDGRARTWTFSRGQEEIHMEAKPRISVNDVLTIQRLVSNGAGIGLLTGHICSPEIKAGRLIHLCQEWSASPVEVNLVFPSRRELSPVVRAFVDFMRNSIHPGKLWMDDPLST